MKITFAKDELELAGENIIIRKRGAANAMASGINGDRTISIAAITAIQMKLGGFWTPGFIQFSYAGSKPFNGGIIAATQDPDAFIFKETLNGEIEAFKAKVEQIMRDSKQASKSVSGTLADELRKLGELRAEGVLSDQEFAAAKNRLIA
ncbi:SHOCT domain-containing protein [Glaciimonas sp. GNP009]